MRRVRLSISEARRIALAAQGFDTPRPAAAPDQRHFRRALTRLGVLQLDYVNVLAPAHFLILFSRLGAYHRQRLERFLYQSGEFTEQWAHEASIVPVEAWPLLAHRREAYSMHKQNPLRRMKNHRSYLEAALQKAAAEGPVTASDLPAVPGPQRKPGDWHRSIPRCALEYHFARGALAVVDRLPNFQRVYDLPERALPPACLELRLSTREAQRELLRSASRSLGIATLADIADYYRMSARDAAPLIEELVDAGELQAVRVADWPEPAYLHHEARLPRRIAGSSLLSPFDPVVWFRPRALRLFDFHYRIEIYVPSGKRRWGYYVLPFRVGERIVARVDLKADRPNSRLRVLAIHEEEQARDVAWTDALAGELHALRRWLGLDEVEISNGDVLSRDLAKAVGADA